MDKKEKTIELEKNMAVKKNHWLIKSVAYLILAICIAAAFIGICNFVSAKYAEARDWTNIKAEEVKQNVAGKFGLVPGAKSDPSSAMVSDSELSDLVESAAKENGIHSVVIWAIIDRESARRQSRIRFEQTWKDSYSKKFPKQYWMNDIEYELVFSSFGLMQIGYCVWKDFCDVKDPTELLDPKKNVVCGTKIMRNCLDENIKVVPRRARLQLCYRKYNGSGPMAEARSVDFMNRLQDYLIDDSQYPAMVEGNPVLANNVKENKNVRRNGKQTS